jgi:hypothetical protein
MPPGDEGGTIGANMTIHAYTESGISCPSYINVSERVANPGDVLVTVRSAGENGASAIALNREQAVALAHDILRHYRAPTPNVKAMVDRFLGWPLPRTFGPDCGISFDGRKDDEWNKNKTWPVGTNLFNADEARAMFEHVLQLDGETQAPNEEEATPQAVFAEFRRMTALLGEQVELMKESRVEQREAMARYDAMTEAYSGGSKAVPAE